MGCGGGECDYVGGGVAEGEEGEVGALGFGMGRKGRLGGGGGGGLGYMCAVYMGREFVLELGGCFCFGALDGAFGTSRMHWSDV